VNLHRKDQGSKRAPRVGRDLAGEIIIIVIIIIIIIIMINLGKQNVVAL